MQGPEEGKLTHSFRNVTANTPNEGFTLRHTGPVGPTSGHSLPARLLVLGLYTGLNRVGLQLYDIISAGGNDYVRATSSTTPRSLNITYRTENPRNCNVECSTQSNRMSVVSVSVRERR